MWKNRLKRIGIGFLILCLPGIVQAETKGPRITLAVEFVAHAACAHIARAKGWYRQAGVNISSFDNYITGMALASALAKGGIQAAYICAIPAIIAYANGGVRLKIVCGTHRYGYGLIVNPARVKTPSDLMRPGLRFACTREGSPADAVMHKMCAADHLDARALSEKALRMPPPMMLLALEQGRIDAGFCCEQFPSMGVEAGFKELTSARALWPGMQGSVLIVTDGLIRRHPDIVKKLVGVTVKATRFILAHPNRASRLTAQALTVAGKKIFPLRLDRRLGGLRISPRAVKRALFKQMECTPEVKVRMIQEEIDTLAHLGYIRRFDAHKIVDLRWLHARK